LSHTPSPDPEDSVDPKVEEGATVRAASRRADLGSARQRLLRWALAFSDAAAILIAIGVTALLGRFTSENYAWAFTTVPIWIFVAKVYNLYDRDHRRIRHSTYDEIPAVVATASITVVLVKLSSLVVLKPYVLPSSTIILVGAVAVVLSILFRGGVRQFFRQLTAPERTIVVGSGRKAGHVSRRLIDRGGAGIDLAGYVASEPNGEATGPGALGLTYAGDLEHLPEAASRLSVSRVVIADDELDSRAIGSIINSCREAQIALTLVPSNQEVLGPETELNRVAEVPMLDFHFSFPTRSTLAIKRGLDILVSGTLLTLTAPLLLISALLIKVDSRGPVFFRQVRVGRHGRRFTIYKLRTMVADAEKQLDDLVDLDALDEPVFKIRDDPRVTRVGRVLRRTSLDEVPQFINVLVGQMSLVGPRPEEEAVVALYDDRQRQRLSVKPGLTGPMQVAGRGSLSFEERLALERDYLDNMTISGDLSILLKTPAAVVRGDGAF
jgi:exopolysaccharide biosynthesis polyprenyl glycosylphosphotransferase